MSTPHPFDLLINSYLADNVGIDPSFLSPRLATGLHQHILQLQADDLMHSAGIGNDKVKDAQQTMRNDKVYWMDKAHSNAFEQEFLAHVEDFIGYLNRTCYTGINGYEFHYAVYEKGSYYKRHKDQFRNEHGRKFSLVNYLNDDWQQGDGGELCLFHEGREQHIIPHSQTAVFFKSDETEHEVTLAHRDRMSISGWLKCV